MTATMIGIDLAKNFFQVHGADKEGRKLWSKKLTRKQMAPFFERQEACTVAMEACGSAHHWGRKLMKMGHQVRLIAPQFVKPFVKSNKNDRNDAEAIVEAALRPSMRFVPVKTVEQQGMLSLHRVRSRRVDARTAIINEIRGLLAEYGVIVPQGALRLRKELPDVLADAANELGNRERSIIASLAEELRDSYAAVAEMDRLIEAEAERCEAHKRLMEIPGVGPLTATAMVASVGNASVFKNGRGLSAWLGLVPRQHSSGGKERLGSISKRGDGYLRKLLVHGARSVLKMAKTRDDARSVWAKSVAERRGTNRAIVAIANKNARIIWALLATGARYETA